MGKMSWPSVANRPAFTTLMVKPTARERDLFGFPTPEHEYWNDQTLADVAARWPGIDLEPYRNAAS